uniref:Peptidase S9 prolyl oligopeptidase catalytic domain-containing protein n=1 Tax=viral metagenome TaxID=1070528 RepID=A0A6C0KQ53_9ZZZZ
MTGEEVRDLGYVQWRDPWAWMEKMKGKRWENLIQREKEYYNELVNQPYVKREARQMEKEITDAQQYSNLPGFKIGCGTIDIILVPNSRFLWKWAWMKKTKPAYDIDVQGNIVWYITTDEDEYYKNLLICEDSTGKKIWSKPAVSSQIAIVDDLCYYVKVIDYFNTVEICVCNAQTGGDERILFREPDEKRDLNLIKGSNKTIYFKSESVLDHLLYKIDGTEIKQLASTYSFQMAWGESIYGEDCLLVRKSKFEKWTARGTPIKDWIMPDEEPEWMNIQTGIVVTMHEGTQTIWFCSPHKKPRVLFRIKIGYIEPNVWTLWENTMIQSFTVKCPFEPPFMMNIINNKIYRDDRPVQIDHPLEFAPLEIHRYHAISKDGTNVPYVMIKEKGCVAKAQLTYVYGAYGSSTPIGWPYYTWYPLLKRNWIIVFAMIRGGGDIDAAWAEMARRDNRHVSVDDFEAVIRESQQRNKLTPQQTVIYGRSAGGLPVGAMVGRFPDGQLMGAAFTEVPYVDVLRTSSNPDLPLTIGEYEEFGNPSERIQNFSELLSVSPVNVLPSDGAPGVFVISHVGLLDRQVFAYESFKWIQKLRGYSSENEQERGNPRGKYVTFEREEAHQYRPRKLPRFRGMDFAILDAWVEGKLKQ